MKPESSLTGRSTARYIVAALAVLAMFLLVFLQGRVLQARSELPPFYGVSLAPDGRVFVPLGDQLYVESPTGQSLEVIPLSRFKLDLVRGDFAVLSDDTLLLKLSGQTNALRRCALKTGRCQEFFSSEVKSEKAPLQLDTVFRLTVDEPAQRLRVAETEHHRLLLVDFDGRILRKREERFRYPSSMVQVAEGEYLVSDTNHARVVRISGRDDVTFGQQLDEFSIKGWSKHADHEFPKGIAVTRDGARWIVVTDGAIAHGELYRQAPGESTTATLVLLPKGTDTMYPQSLGDSVLLPDGGLYRIHRFAADGTRLPDFGSPVLQAALSATATHAEVLELLFKASLLGLLLALGVLISALWRPRG